MNRRRYNQRMVLDSKNVSPKIVSPYQLKFLRKVASGSRDDSRITTISSLVHF